MILNSIRALRDYSNMSRFALAAAIGWMTILCTPFNEPSALADQGQVTDAVDLFPDFSLGGFGQSPQPPVTWSARYFRVDQESARLEVEATIGSQWHLYSLTQKPGGPLPTKLTIESPSSVTLTDAFRPDVQPVKSVSSTFKGLTVEEHSDTVVFSAPIHTPPNFRGEIVVHAAGLVCNDKDGNCRPVEETLTALFDGGIATAAKQSETAGEKDQTAEASAWFRDNDYSVAWKAVLKPEKLAPGGQGVLEITANPKAGFHVYQSAIDDADSATNFVITEKSGLRVGVPMTDERVISKSILPSLPPVSYYQGQVTWKLPIEIPEEAAPGDHKVEGMIAYQACTDNACLQPMALKFAVPVVVTGTRGVKPGVKPDKPAAGAILTTAKRADALDAAATIKWVDKIEPKKPGESDLSGSSVGGADNVGDGLVDGDPVKATTPFPLVLLFALLGGIILNVMPCVLPVVGLKVMSFVQQAGEDRSRILALNVVYSLGILSVFAVLAGLAVLLSFSWGEQFTYFPVRLGLTLLLFALALSYLGVWEIPVPGMAAGKGSQDLQNREGYTGAFFKGVFATILATPCSGPMLGAILGLTISLAPLQTVMVIMTVGLGMAIPYLIIGLRPALVSWLPKPGNWMETLKEFMAFLFLGTVAFFFNQFADVQKLPVFIAMIGVWFGCWMIGKVPSWESIQKRLLAWSGGLASAAVIGILAFRLLIPAEPEPGEKRIHWEPYNETRLAELQAQGRTVMVDFTAKWCVNCIVNYNVALDTEPTREMLEELDAVAMLADWTDQNERIKQKLQELESRSIPLLAIYPGSNPYEPIVLRDLVSQDAVLTALREAGSSVNVSSASSIASQRHQDRLSEVASNSR